MRVWLMRNEKASSQVHHTSISCILNQYFKFLKNLNFQKFSKKKAFFAVFLKLPKKFPTVSFFGKNDKIQVNLKCLRITPICSNKLVQRLRDSLRLGSSVHECQRAPRAIHWKPTADTVQKFVKVTFLQ